MSLASGLKEGLRSSLSRPAVDPDLAEHRRRQILDAITSRYASARASPRKSLDVSVTPFGASHAPSQPQLFDDPDMFADMEDDSTTIVPTANDEALALALQQEELGSDEEEADPELARALAMSRREKEEKDSLGYTGSDGIGGGSVNENEDEGMSDDSMEEVELVPSEQSTPALEEPPFLEDSEDDFEEVPAPAPVPVPVPINPSPDILAPTPIPVAALLSAKKASRFNNTYSLFLSAAILTGIVRCAFPTISVTVNNCCVRVFRSLRCLICCIEKSSAVGAPRSILARRW